MRFWKGSPRKKRSPHHAGHTLDTGQTQVMARHADHGVASALGAGNHATPKHGIGVPTHDAEQFDPPEDVAKQDACGESTRERARQPSRARRA